MPDIVSKEIRSSMMAAVRQKHTKPEMMLRRALHRLGMRYQLHRKDLPGRPDLAFPKAKIAIFVNGCFWHRHEGCRKATTPSTRMEFWKEKFERNVARDARDQALLNQVGWKVFVVWECELPNDTAAEILAAPMAASIKKARDI
ncbi:MAG: very short patch repair endonuclease [Hyphomicrobiales bacterium]|nr:very short patch repair endonuclease [Hyphomicrobiales bacterium]